MAGAAFEPAQRLKILVVDDHALVREGLRQVLKGLAENVQVLEAPHCARAFALADAHGDLDLPSSTAPSPEPILIPIKSMTYKRIFEIVGMARFVYFVKV